MTLTEIDFSKKHQTLKEYLAKYDVNCSKDLSLPLVIIRINKKKAYWLDSQKYYHGFIAQTEIGDEIEMSFLSFSLHGFARWFLMFADCATILQPEALKEEVRGLIGVVSEKLDVEERTRIRNKDTHKTGL